MNVICTPLKKVHPRSSNQTLYMSNVADNDLIIGIGPAGTGKTYLAVAMGVELLIRKKVQRMVIARPAVAAGESLGFLPGDMHAKVDPYMRPIYDALYDTLGPRGTEDRLDDLTIEVAPIAFMRGRTLNDAIVILDEAQNTTRAQMKMFLTRIGHKTKTIVNGDITQIDLENFTDSGLLHIEQLLKDQDGIGISYFTEEDVVRHPLVRRIVKLYAEENKC